MSAANRQRCSDLAAIETEAMALWRRAAAMEVRLCDAEACERVDLTESVLPLRQALASLMAAATQLHSARAALAEGTTGETR